MDDLLDYGSLAILLMIAGFLWSLHRDLRGMDRDLRGLSDRVAKVEGLLEGLRDSIAGRANQGSLR